YCKQDVEVERAISNKLSYFDMPTNERALWALDYRINASGVMIDSLFVDAAVRLDEQYNALLMQEAKDITGLVNPNSPTALRKWLAEQGVTAVSLTKANVSELKDKVQNEEVIRVLELRQEMAKTSTAKYKAMQECLCDDSRV